MVGVTDYIDYKSDLRIVVDNIIESHKRQLQDTL